jgi:hypothetical protein
MDKLFTSDLKLKEKELTSLFSDETRVSPKDSTLDFIKNFARNFRVVKNIDSSLQGFVLN